MKVTVIQRKIKTCNANRMPADNKPIAYMAADANYLTPVLRKNDSDYPSALKLKSPRLQPRARWVSAATVTGHNYKSR